MIIGDKKRWWNRKAPIGRIAGVVGLICAFVWLLPYLALPANDLWWGITHHWTAAYRGRKLPLPFGWRQEEPTSGLTIDLRNSIKRGPSYLGFDWVDIKDSTDKPFDPQQMLPRWRTFEERLAGPGDRIQSPWGDDSIRAGYDCIEAQQMRYRAIRITCFSRNGKWVVALHGTGANSGSFTKILHELSSMPDPMPW
jgi:hypothetical protein